MKTKKIILGLGIALLGSFAAKAQGLQGIIVEKYYQTDANDAANALAQSAASALNVGSTVYRVYVAMAPGYKYNLAFGNANHDWKFTTTTNFYNDPNNGSAVGPQGTSLNNTKKNTVLIDSWLTTGGVCAGKVGVLKIEDTDGSIGNSNGVLANNPGGLYGVAINSVVTGAEDGLAPGTPVAPTSLGLNGADAVFDQTPGNSFLVNGGSVAALGGVVGTTTTNAVLIGQFTTDGTFGFELNIQIQNTVTLVSEIYVAKNAQPGETVFAGCTLAPPTATITAPLNGANVVTGNAVSIAASASASGSITSVQFLVDGTSIGTDLTFPYTASYTATTNGSHTITAIATDNTGATGNATGVVINVAANIPPVITVASPAGAIVGDLVTFTATASDPDGTVASVSFSVNNVVIGTLLTSAPYTTTWTAVLGVNTIRATATDNLSATTISSPVTIAVAANQPPTAAITSPANNAVFTAPQVVTVNATASDPDGTVSQVVFYVNNVAQATLTSAPYTFTWTSVIGAAVLTVKSTDNSGATTTSAPVNLNIANPNALPYEIGTVSQKCTQSGFCLPIGAATTYTVANVIGYDVILNYDATKVTPTGIISVNGSLITPSIVTVINTFSAGVMNISAFFNGLAPANAQWNGTGDIFCVGFTKNASFNSVDTAVFSISSLQESYFNGVTPQLTSNGQYTTFKDSLFNASLRFWSNDSPLPYSTANPNTYLITNIYGSTPACVTNTVAAPVQPDLNGNFTYNILNGSSISIQRDILATTNVQFGINANDVFIGREVLLNTATLTPSVYQMVALDVNLDGVVSAGDLSQMSQRAVLSIPEFKQAWNYNAAGVSNGQLSKDWMFIDSSRVMNNAAYSISSTYPSNDNVGYSKAKVPSTPFCLPVTVTGLLSCPSITNEVYKGVLLGDADGNFATLSSTLQLRPNGDKVVIDLSNSVINGNTVDVPVSFVSASPVVAVDFQLQFDQSNLTYNTMVNYPSVSDALAYFNTNDKTLRYTSTNSDLTAYSVDRPVASIRFETTNGAIDASQLSSLVGILNGQQVPVEVLNSTVGIKSLSSADNSVSVYPNPTSGILNVTSVGDATVQIFDMSGKQVLLQTTVSANKVQQINVSEFVNGVYIMKIFNNDFISINKVVLNK